MEQNIKIALYNAPVGTLLIKYEDDAVVFLQKTTEALQADQPTALSELVFHQLDEYFAGKRTSFDFPFRPKGTPFQMQVWEALQRIPYGEVRSYQDLAASIGRPTAWRACGSAAHANPIAIHEAGHASISWLLEYANPLIKVTIVPRGRALGAAWYLPEERQITTKEQMLDEMCATLGGRAAEDLFLGRISTGAMNDLERVTKQAYGMIAYLGMSEKLPNLCYYNNDEYSFNRPYSEKTAELIDEEVKKMVNEQYQRAKQILADNSEGHNKLAQLLIDKEVIFAEDVEQIFGKRPWASRSEEIISATKVSDELKKAEEKEAKIAAEAEKEVKDEEKEVTKEEKEHKDSKN